ncbi:hypothetical protein LXA43DRAFT_724890 [Ganoderma leucocontextum]|nr:hypothetical protein LXA43DRAFT_724890 [Ganoderma leucocontextum]
MTSYAALYMADSSPQNILLNSYCGVAALALLTYEYIITFDKEVDLFWRGNMSRASALFLFNRYLSLAAIALPRFTMQRMQSEVCKVLVYAYETLDILALFPWAILSSLRAFALSEAPYRWVVTTLVLALALVPIGLNLVRRLGLPSLQISTMLRADRHRPNSIGLPPLITNWDASRSFRSLQTWDGITMICRICTISSDLIVLGVAVNATYKTSRLVRRAMGSSHSPNPQTFTGTILRDGAIYFIIFLILNVAHLVSTWLSLSIDALSAVSFITVFTQPLAAILISRLLSNLQEVKQRLASPRSLPHIGSAGTIHLRPLESSEELGFAIDASVAGDGPPADHEIGDASRAVAEIEEVNRADV